MMTSHSTLKKMIPLLAALSSLGALAQDLSGPMGPPDLSNLEPTPPEVLDEAHALYSRPEFSLMGINGPEFQKAGESEEIDKSSVKVQRIAGDVTLTFVTRSGSSVSIPFYDHREDVAIDVSKRIKAGQSIDL